MEPTRPQPVNNAPIKFNAREFVFGLAIAAAIVFAVAGTRTYIRARTIDLTGTCRDNLRHLKAAKDQWAQDRQMNEGGTPTWTDLAGPKAYIAGKPVCPKGGTYTLGALDQPPRCSVPDHVLP